jgi:hypothetical protein
MGKGIGLRFGEGSDFRIDVAGHFFLYRKIGLER